MNRELDNKIKEYEVAQAMSEDTLVHTVTIRNQLISELNKHDSLLKFKPEIDVLNWKNNLACRVVAKLKPFS